MRANIQDLFEPTPFADAAGLFTLGDAFTQTMKRAGAEAAVRSEYHIKKFDQMEQIVYGTVYAPYVLDSHGEMMLPEDIKKLAHRFLIAQKNHYIDIMHNNNAVQASIVESFIARADDPDYAEGAWVLAVKLFDEDVWADIMEGKLNGYSLEALVYKVEADVTYDYLPIHFGFTEENDGHYHGFWVEVDKDGRVIGGGTSEATGGNGEQHTHKVFAGTATEQANKHGHRYFLNEIDDAD